MFITVRVHCAFTFPTVFYSVSSDSGRGYAASRSHHVQGVGLSSCAWKRVVAMWACRVAKLSVGGSEFRAGLRSVGPWTGAARSLLAVVESAAPCD